jgi:Chaperone of endosialidase
MERSHFLPIQKVSRTRAIGSSALEHNTVGNGNTAAGFDALSSNTGGIENTATGDSALANNIAGDANTATGFSALSSNTVGTNNTASGAFALVNNTKGSSNTATGAAALQFSTGDSNTANGFLALFQNTSGASNTAVGAGALVGNTVGVDNTALGAAAGSAVTDASNVICIGFGVAGANVSNSCFIGNIFGQPVGGEGVSVLVDSSGKLGTQPSSRRFKKDIQPMDKASEVILALKPVTFHYKSDNRDTPQFGLIAEEVAETDPDLVVRDHASEIYTVRYDQVNGCCSTSS